MSDHRFDLDRIEEAAESATPGPWQYADSEVLGIVQRWVEDGRVRYGPDVVESVGCWDDERAVRDRAFIALTDPSVVLALVEVVRAARELASISYETLFDTGSLSPHPVYWQPLLTALGLFGDEQGSSSGGKTA